MACTPPRTPEPAGTTSTSPGVTSMPVSVIMRARPDGTAQPVPSTTFAAAKEGSKDSGFGTKMAYSGDEIIFVENKNTNRNIRNANNGKEQIFVANKDTNRERSTLVENQPVCVPSSPSCVPVPEAIVTAPIWQGRSDQSQVISSFKKIFLLK